MTNTPKTYSAQYRRQHWNIKPNKTARIWKPWTEQELLHIKVHGKDAQIPGRTRQAIRKAVNRIKMEEAIEREPDEGFSHLWRSEWIAEPVRAARSVWEWRP